MQSCSRRPFCAACSRLRLAAGPPGGRALQEEPPLDLRVNTLKATRDEVLSTLRSAGLAAEPTPGQGCLYGGGTAVSATRAQQNFVIAVPAGDGESTFVWTGDRWQQSPDGLKGHEGQFWAPLQFDAEGGCIGKVRWVDEFELLVSEPVVEPVESVSSNV